MAVGEQKETLVRKTLYKRESLKSRGERGEEQSREKRRSERASASAPEAASRASQNVLFTVRCENLFPHAPRITKPKHEYECEYSLPILAIYHL